MNIEPVAFMFQDDYERMLTSETSCKVYSVEVGNPERGTTTIALSVIPEGYALVPIEPTKEMLEAAQLADGDHGDHEDWLGFQWEMGMDQVWAAMLEAAKEHQK